MMLTAWAEKAPPHEHFVMASYNVMEPLRLFKTCRRGCCVDDGICGPMLLPRYWRDATPEEIEAYVEVRGNGWRLRDTAPLAGVLPTAKTGDGQRNNTEN